MKTTIYSWNVNGIRAVLRKDAFLPFVNKYQPDILCLQETKAKEDQVELKVEGYEAFWNSADRPGYSGTLVLPKTKPISVTNSLPDNIMSKYNMADDYGDPNAEGRVQTAEFDKFYVVTVYTVNSKDDLSRIPMRHKHWDPAFLEYCKSLENKKPVVFCGDLNVAHTEDDLARPKPNVGKRGFTKEEREGFDNFIASGFVDSFRLFHKGNGYYTWWSHFGGARGNNVGWRIDYALVSSSLKAHVKAADIYPEVMGSDHCPVSVELSIELE